MKIAFTGGGTAGHAMVNTILIPYFEEKSYGILYLGSHQGMEREMVQKFPSVRYYGIQTGKLRRYSSSENWKDAFRVLAGCVQAFRILKRERPQVLYSGGGYVSVPAVFAAKLLGIPIVVRETDCSVGLANRLCIPFAQKMYTAFPGTCIPKAPCSFPGLMIRPSLLEHTAPKKANAKPMCLVLGGSAGAQRINETVWENLEMLTRAYRVVHLCGQGKRNERIADHADYRQMEFAQESMSALLNEADVVVTRCGSNAISEVLALGKRAVCIPIGTHASRGEQRKNADFAAEHGNVVVLEETHLDGASLLDAIEQALKLDRAQPLHTTQRRMIERIRAHVQEIDAIALAKLEADFLRCARGAININFRDFSWEERMLYDEILTEYGDEC